MTESAHAAADRADPAIAFKRAETLETQGDDVSAEQIYRSLLLEFPDHSAVLHNLALVVRRRGDLAEAERLMRRAVNATPEEAFFQNSLGAILRSAGKLEEAEAAFRTAITMRPELVDSHYNLGLLLEQAGRPADALAAHREATRLKPDFAEALSRVAALLNDLGALDEALDLVDAAIAAQPSLFDAHYYRGWILGRLARHDEALESLARATTLRPGSFEALLATANALRDAGRNEQALAAYWQVLEKQPARLATHRELNHLAWTQGRDDLYLRSFDFARERIGDDLDLMRLEGSFRLRREDWTGAEALARRALRIAPQRGDLIGLLARAMAGQGYFDASYPVFVEAIKAEPNVMLHRQEFGFTLLRGGHPGEALRIFQQVLAVAPHDPLALAGIAQAFRETGDPRYARLVDHAKYVKIYDVKAPDGYEDVAAFNQALARELDALHLARRAPVDQSLRGGTQTTGRLFDETSRAVREVRSAIELAVADYIRTLPEEPDHPMVQRRSEAFAFAGSWSCRLAAGGQHGNHVHHEGWISSAYYVRLPDSVAADDSARRGWLKLGESNLALGERDQAEVHIKPAVGRLVLFPSFYWHGTVPFDDGDRLTLAFDVVPA